MPAAMNFISGGSPLGSSIVSSAANKIVGFQRGSASVAPRPSDLGSIIQTLSSSILNNVETKVQSINQNVSNIVNQTLRSFSKDYQDRVKQIDNARPKPADVIKTLSSNIINNVENKVQSITENVNNVVNQSLKTFGQDYQDRVKQVDDAKPSGILANFLKLYQQAIGFIQFLGNRKNVKTLGDNLQVLQRIFTETFEVAKIIRQTIIKIVKQLSNLPTASTGGGGLNLDIKVPGGPLRRSAPRGVMNMLKMVGTGAAIAGGGALAVNALSGGFGGGGEVQAVPGSGSEGLSGPILDRFNAILERFSAAIDSLSKKKSAPAPPPASSGGGSGTQEKKDPPSSPGAPGASPGTPGGPADFSGSASAEKAFNYFVSQGYTKEQSAGIVGNLMQENRALDPRVANSIGHKGIAQWDPKDRYPKMSAFAKSKGLDPNTLEAQLQFVEQELKTGSGGLSKARLQGTKSVEEAALLVRKQYLRPGEAEAMDVNRIRFGQQVLSQYGGKSQPGKPGVAGKPGEQGVSGKPGMVTPPTKPGVAAASTPAATTQQIAQTVSQPAQQQQQPQVTVLPINLGNQQQPQKPASSGTPQQAQMSSGRQAPSMNASNDDNFLTLYSKMVYNIVDG